MSLNPQDVGVPHIDAGCRSSKALSTSVNPNFPKCAFCSNRCTSHFSSPSAAVRHSASRACISAVCVNDVRLLGAGEYCMRSKHVANCESVRLTEVMVAFCALGSTKDISRTNASSDPPKIYKICVKLIQTGVKTQTHLDYPARCFLFAT
jgi:hypothetical protein